MGKRRGPQSQKISRERDFWEQSKGTKGGEGRERGLQKGDRPMTRNSLHTSGLEEKKKEKKK
jgi:hypothetical protein